VADLGARAGKLARFGVAEPRHGLALLLEARIRPRECVSLCQNVGDERLLADLKLPERGGLGGHGAPGGADLADDVPILLADPLHERQLVQQVLESGGAENHADEVRPIGFVGGDELLGEHLFGVRLVRHKLGETDPRRGELAANLRELGALGDQVRLDAIEPARERGDVRVELPDAL